MSHTPRGCLGFLASILGDNGKKSSGWDMPKVQVNRYFVSDAEAGFFRVLKRVVGDRGHVLAQVSLRQLVWMPGNNKSNPGRAPWQNKVQARSVDFVVCDPATLRPLVAIELDEPSHGKPDRQQRDEEVEKVLQAAGLSWLRVLTSRSYDTRELAASLEPHLTKPAPTRA